MTRSLSAPVTVAFDYTRSTGPVLGRFLTGLRDGRVIGGRTSEGKVVVPPPEFDPVTHDPVAEFVEVAPTGTVASWTWVPEPVKDQPFDRPFAFVLVTLDGADVPMLHALDVSSVGEVSTGMRVQVRWAEERVGSITDIACFEPATDGGFETGASAPSSTIDPVTGVIVPVSLDYLYAASPEESAFYRGLNEGRIVGQRCPTCQKVYVPPRSACPTDGTPTAEEVEVSQTGTITTFCIVNVPFLGQKITPPYVSAYVLLDGADIAVLHLILGVPAAEVRMGMRVKAVWKPREEWTYSLENIDHFEPTGDPDADYDAYKHHL
ncbi:OB-fold nucleic acid binding domain-containing protein [Nocardioides sp. YIM 152315]|uniref:Zn-ribbon domain-containing OB-fold protein n=1 Tax=Nocardioides sp. YIM 152315 TaxID=3031760 RepID=UPI0023DC664C|nr:OB-fold nucleic acid binding domain-containing protein [Nocardioides sp. YIM 152315]MDF1602567.1 OB-fold domain-containing protein [Nocardioides sp. YIM 152315]